MAHQCTRRCVEFTGQLADEGVPDERFVSTPAEYGGWIAQERARWCKLLKDVGVKIE